MTEDRTPFITVYRPIAGWKAVHYWWNPEGFWEPWDTAAIAYGNKEDAIEFAKAWAKAQDLRYVEPTNEP